MSDDLLTETEKQQIAVKAVESLHQERQSELAPVSGCAAGRMFKVLWERDNGSTGGRATDDIETILEDVRWALETGAKQIIISRGKQHND